MPGRTTPVTSNEMTPIDSRTPKSRIIGTRLIWSERNATTAATTATINGGATFRIDSLIGCSS